MLREVRRDRSVIREGEIEPRLLSFFFILFALELILFSVEPTYLGIGGPKFPGGGGPKFPNGGCGPNVVGGGLLAGGRRELPSDEL